MNNYDLNHRRNINHQQRFCLLLLFLLTACAPQTLTPEPPPPTPEIFQLPATWTPEPGAKALETPTPSSEITLASTWTLEVLATLPASLTPIPTKDASFTPVLGFCYQAETACGIAVEPSRRWGWCQMAGTTASCGVIYDYSLLYPQTWIVDTLGAQRPNLLFETGSGNSQVRLIQLTADDLNLENADQALLCNQAGDCLPIVSPDESIVRRRTRYYAGRDFLFLTSSLADRFITRYFVFLDHPTTEARLYIIEIRLPAILVDSEEYNLLLEQADVLLGSIQPDTSIEVTPLIPSATPTKTLIPTPGTPASP